ncbi:MAG: hypothetical protein ABIP78_12585 [Pyrinomonadaceae bacterium]
MKRYLIVILTVGVLVLANFVSVAAQKPKGHPPKKTVDTRLQALPNRQFNHRFTIDFSYDKFTDRTKVQMRLPVNAVESVHFAYFFKGEKLKVAPTDVIFMFFKDKEREFLFPVTDFVILTERDRMRVKMVEAKDLEIEGKNPYTAKLDYPTFLKMANAKTLDVKIGDFEISFDNESMEALKDFASRTSPTYRETKTEKETKALDNSVQKEAARLRRMSAETKTAIREVLVAAKSSMTICLGTYDDAAKQTATAYASQIWIENKAAFTGDIADLMDQVMKTLVRSDILRSVKNGTIDARQFNTQEIVNEYQLAKIPAGQRPKAILDVGDTYLDMVLRIARGAEIID